MGCVLAASFAVFVCSIFFVLGDEIIFVEMDPHDCLFQAQRVSKFQNSLVSVRMLRFRLVSVTIEKTIPIFADIGGFLREF